MNIFSSQSFLELLEELMVGRTNDYTWVIDRDPGDGILRMIRSVSAEEASRPVLHGTTLAAHTEHVRWSLNFALEYLQDKEPSPRWEESWRIKTVTPEEWEHLQEGLVHVYHALRDTVTTRKTWDNAFLVTGLLAVLPHIGYHLGAMRQILLHVKAKQQLTHQQQ